MRLSFSKPKIGQTRIRLKFVLWPVRETSTGDWLWWESVWVREQYQQFSDGIEAWQMWVVLEVQEFMPSSWID